MTGPLLDVTLDELEQAAAFVHRTMPPTPQYAWPKLAARAGCTVWVKHENHTPTGAFEVRGGLVYVDRLVRSQPTALTFADGIATREPNADAVDIMCRGAARFVEVSDDAIAEAMRIYYDDTHQIAEGAGAAPLAALLMERERGKDRHVGVILSGGNIERRRLLQVLGDRTPAAG